MHYTSNVDRIPVSIEGKNIFLEISLKFATNIYILK